MNWEPDPDAELVLIIAGSGLGIVWVGMLINALVKIWG